MWVQTCLMGDYECLQGTGDISFWEHVHCSNRLVIWALKITPGEFTTGNVHTKQVVYR
jgi:hypothetical protein